MGRVVLDDVVDPYSGEVIVPSGTLLTEELAFRIETSGIVSVKIRSVLHLRSPPGAWCAMCYGLNLSTGPNGRSGRGGGRDRRPVPSANPAPS